MSEAAEIADAHARAWLERSREAKSSKKKIEARDFETMAMAAFQVAVAIRALSGEKKNG